MPDAALYHRVSTSDQDPALAREQLREAARARGFTVGLDVEETGSGASNDRPGLQQVLAAARAHKVQAVIVYKLDRFGRSALDLLANIRELGNCGCRFVAATQGIDIGADGDAMSRFMLTILAAVAEFERELIRERTRLGLAKAKKEGRKPGRRPKAVDVDRVRALFREKKSWSGVSRVLGVSRGTLRKALATKGVENDAAKPAENGGAPPVRGNG